MNEELTDKCDHGTDAEDCAKECSCSHMCCWHTNEGCQAAGDCGCIEFRERSTEFKMSKDWHCAKCGKPMQFKDGLCWRCFGGDPGE